MKIIRARLTIVLLLVPYLGVAASPGGDRAPPKPEDISRLLEPIRREHGVPALGGAVIEGDRMIAVGVSGVRNANGAQKVTTADAWHIGSCGKAMTATLIARLVEQRKLKWTTTIGEAFPKLRKKMRPEYRGVTLTQLLSHRSGLAGNLPEKQPRIWAAVARRSGAPRKARMMFVEEMLKTAPEAAPGTRFIYSNAGYAIAGAIAEQATGKSWEYLMKREVFAPLDMRSAAFGPPRGKQPWGHADPKAGGQPVAPGPRADNPAAMGPAGTIHCSLADWGRFVAAHLVAATGKQKFLAESSIETLHKPIGKDEYALGWVTATRSWGGGRVLTHAGTNTMWYAVVWASPKRRFAVLVTTNQGGRAEACDDAAEVLLEYFEGRQKK